MRITKLNSSGRKSKLDLLDDSVPDPILIEIFDYLNAQELATVSLVSKRWNHISKSDSLWTGPRGNYRTEKIETYQKEKRHAKIEQIITTIYYKRLFFVMFLHSPIPEFFTILACTATSILVPLKIDGSDISWLAAILPIFSAFAFQTIKLYSHYYYLKVMEAESTDIFDFHSMAAYWARGSNAFFRNCLLSGLVLTLFLQTIFFLIQLLSTGLKGWLLIPLMFTSIIMGTLGFFKGGYTSEHLFNSTEIDGRLTVSANAAIQAFCFLVYFILVSINIEQKVMKWVNVHIPAFIGFSLTYVLPSVFRGTGHIRLKTMIQLNLGWCATELPPFIFFVLLSLYLDNKLDISLAKVMIPIYIWEGEMLLLMGFLSILFLKDVSSRRTIHSDHKLYWEDSIKKIELAERILEKQTKNV